MNCPIREHTGDDYFVGRCDFYIRDGYCPRHGLLADYPNLDDREVEVANRTFPPVLPLPWQVKVLCRLGRHKWGVKTSSGWITNFTMFAPSLKPHIVCKHCAKKLSDD